MDKQKPGHRSSKEQSNKKMQYVLWRPLFLDTKSSFTRVYIYIYIYEFNSFLFGDNKAFDLIQTHRIVLQIEKI